MDYATPNRSAFGSLSVFLLSETRFARSTAFSMSSDLAGRVRGVKIARCPLRTLPGPRRGRFNESGNVLTLAPIADASVSRKGADENFGNSTQLHVANDGGWELQLLLLLDLALVAESFGPVVGVATLSMNSALESDSCGATSTANLCRSCEGNLCAPSRHLCRSRRHQQRSSNPR